MVVTQGVVVTVGDGEHEVESTSATVFAFVMTPAERLLAEAATLLDGLTVRYPTDSVSVVMHAGGLNAPPSPHHKSSSAASQDQPPYEHPYQVRAEDRDIYVDSRGRFQV